MNYPFLVSTATLNFHYCSMMWSHSPEILCSIENNGTAQYKKYGISKLDATDWRDDEYYNHDIFLTFNCEAERGRISGRKIFLETFCYWISLKVCKTLERIVAVRL